MSIRLTWQKMLLVGGLLSQGFPILLHDAKWVGWSTIVLAALALVAPEKLERWSVSLQPKTHASAFRKWMPRVMALALLVAMQYVGSLPSKTVAGYAIYSLLSLSFLIVLWFSSPRFKFSTIGDDTAQNLAPLGSHEIAKVDALRQAVKDIQRLALSGKQSKNADVPPTLARFEDVAVDFSSDKELAEDLSTIYSNTIRILTLNDAMWSPHFNGDIDQGVQTDLINGVIRSAEKILAKTEESIKVGGLAERTAREDASRVSSSAETADQGHEFIPIRQAAIEVFTALRKILVGTVVDGSDENENIRATCLWMAQNVDIYGAVPPSLEVDELQDRDSLFFRVLESGEIVAYHEHQNGVFNRLCVRKSAVGKLISDNVT